MKLAKIVLLLLVFCIPIFPVTDMAFCRSASLTTTIVITVKAPPIDNLATDDKNAESVRELAKEQSIAQPYIKEISQDTTFSGEKIYSITGRL